MIQIVVNGAERAVDEGTTVAELLRELGLSGAPVAVERNREIVPKASHATTTLAASDRLEVVSIVGGG